MLWWYYYDDVMIWWWCFTYMSTYDEDYMMMLVNTWIMMRMTSCGRYVCCCASCIHWTTLDHFDDLGCWSSYFVSIPLCGFGMSMLGMFITLIWQSYDKAGYNDDYVIYMMIYWFIWWCYDIALISLMTWCCLLIVYIIVVLHAFIGKLWSLLMILDVGPVIWS